MARIRRLSKRELEARVAELEMEKALHGLFYLGVRAVTDSLIAYYDPKKPQVEAKKPQVEAGTPAAPRLETLMPFGPTCAECGCSFGLHKSVCSKKSAKSS